MTSNYTEEELASVVSKLSKLIFVNEEGMELIPTKEQVEKMLALCKKRSRPSYYKLRHASGLGEEYGFKAINMYSNDGKKMRRFESGLDLKH
ncbi:MAG: Unknown protein [uncultured Sulfurovum sp.]|uniref:Uncharacterized protein n=1 Tax=uncultured Sulfurovum sp. TaxID=269237 RepID=A0A6S6TID5_9BACT|nr:MAG: Unknown protein [uncultured Sulfurovum sp.]